MDAKAVVGYKVEGSHRARMMSADPLLPTPKRLEYGSRMIYARLYANFLAATVILRHLSPESIQAGHGGRRRNPEHAFRKPPQSVVVSASAGICGVL